jgi:hypothetical protein
MGPDGEQVVIDKVNNKELLVFQHHDERRPVIRHRTLVAVLIHLASKEESRLKWEQRADLLGKRLAYDLLVDAALKTPHEMIDVDVAVFLHDPIQNGWTGTGFPLRGLHVTGEPEDEWKNLLELERVIPFFFFRWRQRPVRGRSRDFEVLPPDPTGYLKSTIGRQTYQAVLVCAFARARDRLPCLPSLSVVLPQFDRSTHTVLLCCTEDGIGGYHGNTFRSLVGAHMARMPLPRVEASELIERFTSMLVGPILQDGATWLDR